MDNIFKDRLFRYSILLKDRNSKKRKKLFLKTLLIDIITNREDVMIMEYKLNKNKTIENLYVGDIESADYIVCTYYDTPLYYFGKYVLFNRDIQAKYTYITNGFLSLLWITLGVFFTYFYFNIFGNRSSILINILIIFLYIIYFLILSKISKGRLKLATNIRNTSSVLCLLEMIKYKNNKVAFAFIDDGCFNDESLKKIVVASKKSAKIYYLDSIGTNMEINFIGKDFQSKSIFYDDKLLGRINYIFCARKNKNYYLLKRDINGQLNLRNIEKVISKFNEIFEGK